jgi:hypothetical protein
LKKRWLCVLLVLLGLSSPGLNAEPAADRFLAFATWDMLFMAIGKYNPKSGWTNYQDFYHPSQTNDIYTLYTLDGEIAQVTDVDDQDLSGSRLTPLEWTVRISTWHREGQGEPFALAVAGQSPLPSEPAHKLPLNDPELIQRVSEFLNTKNLNVPRPNLTQAYEVNLSSGGLKGRLICAHSDAKAMQNHQASPVYALALLLVPDAKGWKTFPLELQKSFKPAFRSIDEHERLFGIRDYYRFLSCLDIDGDGWKEVVVYDAQEHYGTQIDVFSFDGRRITKRISAFKHVFN